MKKNIFKLMMTVLMFSGVFSVSAAGLVEIEHAIESEALGIRLSNDLKGVIKGRRCDRCDVVLVKITPATKFNVNGIAKPLIEAQKWAGKPGTAVYNIKTKEVRSISIYQ